MKIFEQRLANVITDVLCDVCSQSTSKGEAVPQFGTLAAQWGYGSQHDGEQYEIHLCEHCFFHTLSGLKSEHMVNHMFDEEQVNPRPNEDFGLVSRDNFFND